jgi:hypothetical protein
MKTKLILTEVYDENGLVNTYYTEVEDTTEQDILDREAQLLEIYEEIKKLKSSL